VPRLTQSEPFFFHTFALPQPYRKMLTWLWFCQTGTIEPSLVTEAVRVTPLIPPTPASPIRELPPMPEFPPCAAPSGPDSPPCTAPPELELPLAQRRR